jgi:MoxR-like ATPase
MQADPRAIQDRVQGESALIERTVYEVGKVIVGQKGMIERILIALLTGGHVLIEGVPGLAKTLAIRTVSQAVSARFQRIQFTPDLLPADLVGTVVYNQQAGTFTPKKGPIFTNLLLADEINRAPAKVQSALLEAMQERQVTIGDTTYPLQEPFLVMATQNPVEQEGTYPLPEAQVDRFMLKVLVDYPDRDEELTILDRWGAGPAPVPDPVLQPEDVMRLRGLVDEVYISDLIRGYIVDIVLATRDPKRYRLADLTDFIEYGASPRASLALARASRAHAVLRHRGYVTPEDIKAIGPDVLRHRVILTYEAEAEEVTSERIVQRVLETVPVP